MDGTACDRWFGVRQASSYQRSAAADAVSSVGMRRLRLATASLGAAIGCWRPVIRKNVPAAIAKMITMSSTRMNRSLIAAWIAFVLPTAELDRRSTGGKVLRPIASLPDQLARRR